MSGFRDFEFEVSRGNGNEARVRRLPAPDGESIAGEILGAVSDLNAEVRCARNRNNGAAEMASSDDGIDPPMTAFSSSLRGVATNGDVRPIRSTTSRNYRPIRGPTNGNFGPIRGSSLTADVAPRDRLIRLLTEQRLSDKAATIADQMKKLAARLRQSQTSNGRLDLSSCRLAALPIEAVVMTTVTRLDASDNAMERLPEALPMLASFGGLEELRVSANRLTNLPSTFERFSRLKLIDISKNNFSIFPRLLFQIPSLRRILFLDNKIRDFDVESTRQATWLEELDLHGNPLSDKTIDRIEGTTMMTTTKIRFTNPKSVYEQMD